MFAVLTAVAKRTQMIFSNIEAGIAAAGLVPRGAFHPSPADRLPPLPDGRAAGTLVLVGFAGGQGWPAFAASPEAADGEPHPLDRWSRRVIGALAEAVGAAPLFPFGGPPFLPFHEWARAAEPVFTSPLGVLIHPRWGLWHSYRGALAFAERITLPARAQAVSPCDGCAARPCLDACPVGAFTAKGYDVPACVGHLRSGDGTACLTTGCLARGACPVGAEHRYTPAQAEFHMAAFLAAQ